MLRIDGLTVRFGGVEALGDLALAVAPGETVGLIGPNGAGKTTLFDAVTGVVRPAGGRIRIAGRDANGLAPHAIAGLGVARTFQGIRLFRRLSALDNVRAGRRVDAEAWLERVGLKHRSNALPDELAPAEQRRLELARALAADPRLLLLDEPVGGLTPAETDDLERLLRTVALPGRATILIEHRVDLVAALCRRIVVLDFGRKIADGAPDEVLRDSQVRAAYLGQPDRAPARREEG